MINTYNYWSYSKAGQFRLNFGCICYYIKSYNISKTDRPQKFGSMARKITRDPYGYFRMD